MWLCVQLQEPELQGEKQHKACVVKIRRWQCYYPVHPRCVLLHQWNKRRKQIPDSKASVVPTVCRLRRGGELQCPPQKAAVGFSRVGNCTCIKCINCTCTAVIKLLLVLTEKNLSSAFSAAATAEMCTHSVSRSLRVGLVCSIGGACDEPVPILIVVSGGKCRVVTGWVCREGSQSAGGRPMCHTAWGESNTKGELPVATQELRL